jgi:hypothetical protein
VNFSLNRAVELNGAMKMDDAFEGDIFPQDRKISTLAVRVAFLFVPHNDDPLLSWK